MVRPIGGFQAVGRGFQALRRNASLWLFGFGAEAAISAARMALGLAASTAFAARFARGAGESDATSLGGALHDGFAAATSADLVLPLAGAAFSVALLGAVLRLVYLSAAVVDASATLKEPAHRPAPVLSAALGVLPRAVVSAIWIVIVDLSASLITATIAYASLLILGRGMAATHGLGAVFVAAVGFTVALVLAVLAGLFARVYRVLAIRRLEVSALAAAWEAGASLGRHLGAYALMGAVIVALEIAGGMVTGGPALMASAVGPRHVVAGLALRLVEVILAAAWSAALELVLVGAICALDLDERGELPRAPEPPPVAPPPAPVIVPAQEILIAQAIEPPPSSSS